MNDSDNLKYTTRSRGKHLRVTFPNGNVICYDNVTYTFTETLRQIGPDKLKTISLAVAHLPLISDTLYPKLKNYQKELFPGWYVNIQSDSAQKFMQLKAINNQLNLNLNIELGEGFETDKASVTKKRTKKAGLNVKLSDEEVIACNSPIETYREAITRIGIDKIARKALEIGGKALISVTPLNKNYVEIEKNRWLYIPASTKEKAKYLKLISSFLHLHIEITTLE